MILKNYRFENNQLLLHTEKENFLIQYFSPDILHVRVTTLDHFNQRPSLIVLSQPANSFECVFEEQEKSLILSSGDMQLEIIRNSTTFTWRDQTGNLLLCEPVKAGKHLDIIQVVNTGQPPSNQSRKAYQTKLAFDFQPDEAIFGLGQHEEGILNYRGHSQFLYQNNMKIAMPVLISTKGWGLLFDSYSMGVFHDDQYGSYYCCDTEDELDYYFIYGPSFDRIVSGIRQLTGAPAMLPRWAYGYIQSKERYKDQAELVEIVKTYRKRRIPLDGIIQDWQYWDEGAWGQKSFDAERYPDPSGLIDELHKLNAHTLISVWPNFAEVEHKKPFVDHCWLLPDNTFYNVFDSEARNLHWQQMNEGIFRHGFDGWWCDCAEPYDGMMFYDSRYRPEPWERAALNKAEFTKNIDPEYINVYSLFNSQGVYEGQRSVTNEKRVVNLTRSAFPGQQRYGTIVWSGDSTATWDTLKWHIPAGLNTTVTGFPNWTLDVGAFFVKDNREKQWWWAGDYSQGLDDLGYRELYVRWFQYAAFLPVFRSHGTDIDREIFRFGRPGDIFFDALYQFVALRYRLLPYIYSLAAWETQRGYTMHRMLAFDFPDDRLVHDIKDQFMLGPSIMVCPVTDPMIYGPNSHKLEGVPKIRRVYLPKGCDWYDFWSGVRYQGGQEITPIAPLDIIPLFVRSGSILPLGPVTMYADEKPHAPLEIRVYPGGNAIFDLYEDEGDSYRYELGAFAWTRFHWNDQTQNLVIEERQGSYPGMLEEREVDWLVVREEYGIGVNETGLNIQRAISKKLLEAKQLEKELLLIFGAEWCPDCTALEILLTSDAVSPYVNEHFLLLKIDVFTRFTNRGVVETYGSPTSRGIPSIVILNGDGQIVAASRNGELANARSATPEDVLKLFSEWRE
jgi:alpha-D-xyloside xylohydrolase